MRGAPSKTQYISPQIEWKLGYTQEEWTSDPGLWESRIHPDDRSNVRRARDEFLRFGEPFHVEYRLLSKDDDVIAIREEATQIAIEGEETARIHGVLLDVSETVDARVAERRAQEASRELVQVQEDERRHLARELHDEVGQSLTMLRMLLEMLHTTDSQVRAEKLQLAMANVQDLMSKVHDLALDLRPGMLDDLGLLPALVWLTERVAEQSKLNVTLEHNGLTGARLPENIETCVYRVVQEALTNCVRHAGTANVRVRVWMTETTLNVQIEDDGSGFDMSSLTEGSERAGLTGIRERATALGGEFEVESQPGEGCRILVQVPREGSHADG
jgi:signal transduction histidine kinase